jgi:NAD(P)-dependent dehydrogenase (short-subunit alcohol dehydrogenase family)
MTDIRWALVVGGSRGLGAACAVHLARRGHSIAFTYHRNVAAANATTTALLDAGAPTVQSLAMDLADPVACELSVLAFIDELGPPHCLVHSAAELVRASVADTDIDTFARTLTTNCTSAYAVARTAGLAMHGVGGGSITVLSSVIGPLGVRDRVAYATSKAGLIGMAKALAVELAPTVRVNAIMLGTFATDMNEALQDDAAALEALQARVPLARLGNADEVGQVAAFLADEATFVTGAVWEVDGGVSARLATPTGDPSARAAATARAAAQPAPGRPG